MSRHNASLDRWWLIKYHGVANPAETCPTCHQTVRLNPVDGCFQLHCTHDVKADEKHPDLCKMSGKRAPKS
jgi:hypothetical protein